MFRAASVTPGHGTIFVTYVTKGLVAETIIILAFVWYLAYSDSHRECESAFHIVLVPDPLLFLPNVDGLLNARSQASRVFYVREILPEDLLTHYKPLGE